MELEWPVGDRVVSVSVPLIQAVSGRNMIDLVMRHHTGADQDKPAEHRENYDDRENQFLP